MPGARPRGFNGSPGLVIGDVSKESPESGPAQPEDCQRRVGTAYVPLGDLIPGRTRCQHLLPSVDVKHFAELHQRTVIRTEPSNLLLPVDGDGERRAGSE